MSRASSAIAREWAAYLHAARSPEVRETVLWCLPALLLGLVLRAALELHFPYGYFQGDSPDFLLTAERFVKFHALVLHGKKAFLAPILFTVPFLLHIPALLLIPLAQHLAGLAATLAAGGLVRCWFRHWKWFIVPLTLLYTANPAMLWFEHALLAEALYLDCATLLALAGTLFALHPTIRRMVWLIVALFFTAGSRPEGKLYVAVGLGLVALAYLGQWKLWLRRIAVMLLASAAIWMCSRSTQAGLLLYATVLPLAPQVSTVAPGVEQYLAPLRQAGADDDDTVRTSLNHVEKTANTALKAYLDSKGATSDDPHVSALAQKLALEAIRNRPGPLPAIAKNKFLLTCRFNGPPRGYADTSGGFTPFWIYGKQSESLSRRDLMLPLLKGLTGRDIHTDADIPAFLHEKFQPLSPDWFTPIQRVWSRATLGLQFGGHGADKRFVPGWPAFWLLGIAGMLAALVPRDRLWRFHLPWVAGITAVWLAVMLTGVVNPRYRFVFEPFVLLYAALLLDFLWSAAVSLVRLPNSAQS